MNREFRKRVWVNMKASGNTSGTIAENALPVAAKLMNEMVLEDAVWGDFSPDQVIPFDRYMRFFHIDCNVYELRKHIAGEWLDTHACLVPKSLQEYRYAFVCKQLRQCFSQIEFSQEYIADLSDLFAKLIGNDIIKTEYNYNTFREYDRKKIGKLITKIYRGERKIGMVIGRDVSRVSSVRHFDNILWDNHYILQTDDLNCKEFKLLVLSTFHFFMWEREKHMLENLHSLLESYCEI